MTENVNWDEAVASSGFISLESDKEKKLIIRNIQLLKVEKFGKETIELQADCIEEDGEKCEKMFTTSSRRLKQKLRPILEKKDPTSEVKLSILRVGDRFDTQYSVKEW
jgi:hypothetical protein